jgi:hypothetical protein
VEIDWNWQELEEKEDCQELANVSKVWSLMGEPNFNWR